MEWELWIPLILGSSVLVAFIAFGLELGKSTFKERDEHNRNIVSICNELKTIRKTLETEDLSQSGRIDSTTVKILLPTASMDSLIPKIIGKIKSETLNDLEQIHEDAHHMKNSLHFRRDLLNVKEEIGKINHVLEEVLIKNGGSERIMDSSLISSSGFKLFVMRRILWSPYILRLPFGWIALSRYCLVSTSILLNIEFSFIFSSIHQLISVL